MEYLVLKIILFLGFILMSAFFSSSETAYFSLNRRDLEEKKEAGQHSAERVLRLLDRPRRLLITIVTGNTFINISLGVLSASIAHDIAREHELPETAILFIEVIAVTFTVLVFGEIIPKVLAIRHSESYSMAISRLISGISTILKPMTEVFFHMTEAAAHLFGVQKEQLFNSEEDFYTLVELGEREGAIRKKEKDMIKSLVKFSETSAREVMIPRADITAVDISLSTDRIMELMSGNTYSRYPVYETDLDTVRGFIFKKDLLKFKDLPPDQMPELRSLLRPVLYVPETKSINLVLKDFQHKKTKIAIVADEYGGTSGMITLEDVLEEILGEIQDEKDTEDNSLHWVGSHEVMVDAAMNIDDIGEVLDVEWPEERNYDTLGGFVMESLGRLPKRHDMIQYAGHEFHVDTMVKRRIKRIRIKK